MRLWHKDLIPYLPRQQLLGQWRECCLIAKQIAEKGTPNHVLVNKVTDYGKEHLWKYGDLVLAEMVRRRYKCDFYKLEQWLGDCSGMIAKYELFANWHNDRYLRQCLANLQEKYDCGAIPEGEWKQITHRWPEFK